MRKLFLLSTLLAVACGSEAAPPPPITPVPTAQIAVPPALPPATPTPMPPAQPPLANPGARVDAARIQAALDQIEAGKRTSGATADAVIAQLTPQFESWGALMTELTSAGQHDDADRVAQAIVAMRNAIDPTLFPRNAPDAFLRDRFVVDGHRIDAVQFFEPVRYYPNDPSIMKLYRFSVYSGENVVVRFYLEHSNIAGDYYVLGRAEPSGHRQVQPYGPRVPTYAEMRSAVLADLAVNPAS